MKIRKISEKYNPPFKRRELVFFIDHVSSGTPRLYDIRKTLAKENSVDENNVYILKMNTLTGTNRAVGMAEIYENPERANALVPEYIRMRNNPSRRERKKD